MRDGMRHLVSRLRLLIGDAAGTAAQFSDDELQGFCDDNRTDVRYLECTPVYTLLPGGTVEAYQYQSGRANWEGTPVLVNSAWGTLTPSTVDLRRGVFDFSSDTDAPVYITGQHYDLYAVAVLALESWIAVEKGGFDFTADGASFRRSQKVEHLERMAERYRGMMGQWGAGSDAGEARLTRNDLNVHGW